VLKIDRSSQKLLVIIIAVVITCLLATGAIANAPAPPKMHWLTFHPDKPALEGLQLIQCESAKCLKPVSILHHQTCNKAGCIPGAALVEHIADASFRARMPHFACIDNKCFWSFNDVLDLGTDRTFNPNLLKIVAQFPDRVRASNVFKLPDTDTYDPPTEIEIGVGNTDLLVTAKLTRKEYSASNLAKAERAKFAALALVLLSVGSEIVVAYSYLRRQQPARPDLQQLLRSVLLVHLFSLAIVWISFPALAAFVTRGVRTSSIVWISMSLVYGLLVTAYYSIGKQPKKTYLWVIGTICFWLLAVVVSSLCLVLDYGASLPLSTELFLPAGWILPTSEIFVWIYESWIIYVINKHWLDYRKANLLSLLMNLTSLVLGLIAHEIGNYLIKSNIL
jgi:hypothetical protein